MPLCPQVPSRPSPTWPRAWPGTWTGCRWTRSTTTGRKSGGGSSQRAWARGSGRACPGWASVCSVRGGRRQGRTGVCSRPWRGQVPTPRPEPGVVWPFRFPADKAEAEKRPAAWSPRRSWCGCSGPSWGLGPALPRASGSRLSRRLLSAPSWHP